MRVQKPKVIGIIMTYECAYLLKRTYSQIPKGLFDEIIVVDDGSTDNVAEVAKKLGTQFFTHKHLGYGGNLKFGLRKAYLRGADYMVEIHGDGQYDPSFIPQALEKAKLGYDLLLGSRFQSFSQPLKDGMPLARYLANILFSTIDRMLFQIPLSEFYTGFRIYSRKLVETVGFENTSNGHSYNFQIIIQAKFYNLRIGEIPVRCIYTREHTSESFWGAAMHSIDTFRIFAEYTKAKFGFKTPLFHRL